uniref:Gem-associated protein 2 n=1 Tax=Ascaris lumbricoides TaxID=6252 RepID=A0A0M3HZL6_ASCLU
MEQEAFLDLDEFNESEINLDEPPRSAIHYLQQVAVSRKRCPQVVKASLDPSLLSNKPSSSEFNKEELSTVNAPTREWAYAKCDEFSWNRTLLQARRAKYEKPAGIVFPGWADYGRWRLFCLGEKEDESERMNKESEEGANEQGNVKSSKCGHMPTPAIVMNLSENEVNSLIQHLVQVFLEEGYSKQLFLWLYSVLLVVQKPLLHDVCASLRSFAKQCRLIRAMLTDDGSAAERGAPTTNEFSLFVALVSIYFEQKDLADHQ